MPSVTVFGGAYCLMDTISERLANACGLELLDDRILVDTAARMSGLAPRAVERAFSSQTSVFNTFTHEKERAVAFLRLALAEALTENDLLIHGFAAQLAPMEISHLLRLCLISDLASRIDAACREDGCSSKDAQKKIQALDEDCRSWMKRVRGVADPWDASAYDILIPTDKIEVDGAVALITENLGKSVLRETNRSRAAIDDFRLAAEVEVALAKEGHSMEVYAREGVVTVLIHKNVLLLNRLKDEIAEIAGRVEGVARVETDVGEGYYKADVYRRFEFETPNRVLLVDDEREFVQTLSERLQMREVGSAVVFDGETALEVVTRDEPEVMILDLKMPGIDGIEVLRRVKQSHPEIEVVILTGHGTEADRETCLDLGAFEYLQKPVDIDLLSETLRRANQKARDNIKLAAHGGNDRGESE